MCIGTRLVIIEAVIVIKHINHMLSQILHIITHNNTLRDISQHMYIPLYLYIYLYLNHKFLKTNQTNKERERERERE